MTNAELQAALKANQDELEAKITASDNAHKGRMLELAGVAHRALYRIEQLAHDTGEVSTYSGGEPKTAP